VTTPPTVLLVPGRAADSAALDDVAALLADTCTVVRTDTPALRPTAGPVHIVTTPAGVAALWPELIRPDAGAYVASLTVIGGARRRLGRRDRPGSGRLDLPLQVLAAPGDRTARELTARTSRAWYREVPAGRTAPAAAARAVTELADHLGGAPAARELLRAQVGRERAAFGDTLVAVTGAGSGIGRETALAFARLGAELVVSDIDPAGLDETVALLTGVGAAAHPYRVDVADGAAVEQFAEAVCAEHGVPDVVVNNAGVGHAGFFLDTPAEEYDRVMGINFGGVVNGCRSFGRRLVARGTGGHIVNVASMASYTPVNAMNAYCTSKAAVFMFSDCLRAELDAAGVGLTTICPGVIGTNIVRTTNFSLPESRRRDTEAIRRRAQRGFSLRHVGPQTVARAIVDAVQKKAAVRPVTAEAHLVYAVAHAFPQVMRSTARGGNIM
jgi:NAD(P)-dependent dehydrogenase (short-subunit alcohol dehydrogenase family)